MCMLRIAVIGLGNRGLRTVQRYAFVPRELATITVVVDIAAEAVEEAQKQLQLTGQPAAVGLSGENAWKEACRREDVDVALVCTSWDMHAEMACHAMECGKDVAVEVPLVKNREDGQRVIETSRRTGKQCFMMENCCYDRFHICCMEMKKQGVFGDIVRCEGAYIHRLGGAGDPTRPWMLNAVANCRGNAYPTHAFGPMAQLLDLGDGDAIDKIVSLSPEGTTGMNDALIKTKNGKTALLLLDVSTPRPYSRLQTVCGTKAYVQKYPVVTVQTLDMDKALTGEEAEKFLEKYFVGHNAELWQEGHDKGMPNEMNYAMDCDFLQALTEKRPLPIRLEDAVEWSCLTEATEMSLM